LIQLVSLFTGAGGLDLAFERSGPYKAVARVELEPSYCDTLIGAVEKRQLSRARLLKADIRFIAPSAIAGELDAHALKGMIAGPPCESFSCFGSRHGAADPRGRLVFSFVKWAATLPFDFVVFENVPNFVTIGAGQPFTAVVELLETAGYSVSYSILNAADFGAATIRRRLVLVGVRDRVALQLPAATHRDPEPSAGSAKSWVSAGSALDNLPPPSLTRPGAPSWHVAVRHTEAVRARFADVRPGTQDPVRHRYRLRADRPSFSLVAGNHSGTRALIHPTEARELTNRECARIQGFPDDFDFAGTRSAVMKQIANAVPLPLGDAVARSIASQLVP
jgi:DNA (cytosine-5)-methyltransferase 1